MRYANTHKSYRQDSRCLRLQREEITRSMRRSDSLLERINERNNLSPYLTENKEKKD